MATAKLDELRGCDDAELENRLAEAKQELFNLRFKHVTGELPNMARLGDLRRDIARIFTLLREREIEAFEAAEATEAGGGAMNSAAGGGAMDAGEVIETGHPERFFAAPQTQRAQQFLARFRAPHEARPVHQRTRCEASPPVSMARRRRPAHRAPRGPIVPRREEARAIW